MLYLDCGGGIMDFANKSFTSLLKILLYVIITIACAYLFLNLLPIILLAAAAIALFIWGNKKFKNYQKKSKMKRSNPAGNENICGKMDSSIFDIQGKNVIDVEYSEVKK
jgi:hypothetical protein